MKMALSEFVLLVEGDAFERINGDADNQEQRKQQDDDMQYE